MQPETKVKENGAKAHTPTEQWDHLAFQVIFNELAPKGFNKGTEYVKVTKKSLANTQKIAAQLIRGFRDKAKKGILDRVKETEGFLFTAQAKRNACWFWQFQKKADLSYEIAHLKGQIGKAYLIAEELNSVTIK